MNRKMFSLIALLLLTTLNGLAQETTKAIPAGAKVFINPMKDEYEKFLALWEFAENWQRLGQVLVYFQRLTE